VGCGYGGPGPAERVQVADIVGRWVDRRSPSGFLLFGGVEDCMDPDSCMCLYWSPLAPEQ